MDTSNYLCTVRRPCFIDEDVGLASIADTEAGFSGNHHSIQHPYFSSKKRGSFRSLSSLTSSSASPRSVRLYDTRCEDNHHPHFLEACFLCKKALGNNRDIFMYRGDTPFCSEECRQEQIEIDEAKEKNRNISSMKAMRKDQQKSTPNSSRNYQIYNSECSFCCCCNCKPAAASSVCGNCEEHRVAGEEEQCCHLLLPAYIAVV